MHITMHCPCQLNYAHGDLWPLFLLRVLKWRIMGDILVKNNSGTLGGYNSNNKIKQVSLIFFRNQEDVNKVWASLTFVYPQILSQPSKAFLFCGGRGLNLEPCIFYALFIPTELSSRGQSLNTLLSGWVFFFLSEFTILKLFFKLHLL